MKNVGIIAPSGEVCNPEKLLEAENIINSMGINVKIFPGCNQKFRYMAGGDETRLQDIHDAYLDENIDTIIAARGGYGVIRLLDKIDYEIIKNNPKKIIGSSDITALLLSIFKQTGKITYHGKMALNGISNMSKKELEEYKNAVENDVYNVPEFTGGKPSGILWGGNLATIVSMFGAPDETYIPDEDIILFIEDINEPDYKIDRMLSQILRNKALKDRINGVIFGEFIGSGEYLKEISEEFIKTLNVPYAYDDRITHGTKNTVIPIGLKI